MKTKQLVIDAMMAAMCAVLGYLALDLGAVKVTFESLPILLSALLFGPVDGMLVGGVGTLVYQLLRYGVTATTLLWILPYVVCGLIVGAWAKKKQFMLSRAQTVALVVAAELVVTGLNTGALYADSHIYGWYYPGLIMGVLGLRLAICVGKAVAFGVILPTLAEAVRRAGHRRAV
jgi:ECF transporter S component (folate family)